MESPTPNVVEPPDHHGYDWVTFYPETFDFYFKAVCYYQELLENELAALQSDDDLKAILGDKAIESYPIGKEIRRAKHARESFEEWSSKAGEHPIDYEVNITHGFVRFLKSVCRVYLDRLHERRETIAQRPNIAKGLLDAIDQQLAKFEEKINLGVFKNATPLPLVVKQIDSPPSTQSNHVTVPPRPAQVQSRPVVLDTIEIRDLELRNRCLDLLAQFREDGAHDRLDTVVTEATRILEDRLRTLAGAPAECVGIELAKFAFGPPTPRLVVSSVSSEQESAHLLFRGTFGFIRNSVHHRLVGNLQPERVLQIVGLLDYLISVAEGAQRTSGTPRT